MLPAKKKETKTEAKENALWNRIVKYRFLYVLVIPALIWVLIFCYLPLLGNIMALQDFNIKAGFFGSKFVGMDNFVKIFTMPKFTDAIKNTLVYSSVTLFLGLPFPIVFALLLNELRQMKFKKIVQTLSYLPYFLSWISVIGIFYSIFAVEGIYNDIMIKIVGDSWKRSNILMNPDNFLGIIFWSDQWKNLGWNTIVYLAAIAGIDQSMYESAKIDGCGRFKQAIYLTLPSIMPTLVILLVMSMGSLVTSNFTQIFGFQNIYTQEYTETISTISYRSGIQGGEYSLATALGMMQGVISFLLVITSNWLAKKLSGSGIW